ncbi:MAG TPA: hypothetical protein VGS09_06005, partial [Actinomycetota bacterium]|nr:hypothetical protein [Actinomycetota bacterium]
EALALLRDDTVYPGGPGSPVARGDKDKDWLPIVGENDWVVIMRDKRMRWRSWELEALREAGLRVFSLRRAGNYTRWEVVTLLARFWPGIEATAEAEAGPYVYSVTQAGLRRMA